MPIFTNLEFLEPSLSLLDYPLVYQEPLHSFPLSDPRPNLFHAISSRFELLDNVLDLAHFERRTRLPSCYRRIRSTSGSARLYDRAATLDLVASDPVLKDVSERKNTWTAEIKCPGKKWLDQKYKVTEEIKGSEVDRKYKWTAEIESPEKIWKYKWMAEIEGDKHGEGRKHKEVSIKIKKPESGAVVCTKDHKYKWTAETDRDGHGKGQKHKEVSIKIKEPESGAVVYTKDHKRSTRLVEIEEPLDKGAIYLRQAFAKRAGAVTRARGKAKVLSPEAAALMIQVGFRTYLIRRSQTLRSLRELAITKAKLKEIRMLFNNFTYRRCITSDVEERKSFAERIIALLLSVDAIQGADLMVRAARRSMLDELEAMLDLVDDPQPPGKPGFSKGRRFENSIQREIATGVADVVRMLDQVEKSDNATFQVCL
ncbi:BAG DOMAIN CONTAINING PROTEIN EXPRESSED [Salix viminalis]|uniref:BAG DOMAIN CONTAINING PROTEIN EXPRESSED n=1 Tax=Salix viminalis TaxID=40686 RepID=A0A9Q0SFK0_SALVM|nr:BAG DOMAIN CONTAINING PROTEIN EXPRESSED [Salix viminalis]